MIDKEVVAKARSADLATWLINNGYELKKEGKQYRVIGKAGVIIKDNQWYDHISQIGGNCVDYLVNVEKMSFQDAVETLTTTVGQIDPSEMDNKDIELPTPNKDERQVMAYLIKKRGIRADIVKKLLKMGLVYEDADMHNCVFIGKDKNENIRYALCRSTRSDQKYEVNGSDKRYSFSLNGTGTKLMVFESPIGLLSFISIYGWDSRLHFLSLGGLTDLALEMYLSNSPDISAITFCIDTDDAANGVYKRLSVKYRDLGYVVKRMMSEFKDWNELLLNLNS